MESNGSSENIPKRTPTARFKLPKLDASLSESLTTGTDIPPPLPPPPPPKDAPPIITEKTIPTIPQPEIFSEHRPSTANTMPGAFPTSPMESPSASPQTPTARPRTKNNPQYAPGYSLPTTPGTASPRTPRGISRLFRPLSRFYGNSSSLHDSSPASGRPSSPGSSTMGSGARPSLNHKKSGSFWERRKSSLGMKVDGAGQNGFSSPAMNGSHTVVEEDVERSSPALGEADVRLRLNKKKSGTFWGRRKSSFGMPLDEAGGQDTFPDQHTNINDSITAAKEHTDSRTSSISYQEDERPLSPPPRLPEVVEILDGGSLGAEDLFKNIG